MRSFCRIQGIMGCTPNSVLILFIVYRLSFGYFKDSLEWESIHWLYVYIWPILTGVCWQVPPPNFLFLNRGISRHRGSSHRLGAAVCSTGGKYSYRLRLILPKWPNIFFLVNGMALGGFSFMVGFPIYVEKGGGSLTWKLAFRNDLKEQFGSQEWWNLFVTCIFPISMDLLDPFDLGDPGKRAISLCLANANPPWKIPISPWILAENPESKTPEFWLKRESTAFTRMVSRFSVAIQWMELLVVEIGWSEACQQGLMDAYGNDAWFNICFLFMYVHRKTWGDIPVWLGYW